MSGGRWGYKSWQIAEEGLTLSQCTALMDLLGPMEHVLDWGVSADTCADCAVIAAGEAMIAFFDYCFTGGDLDIAIETVQRRRSVPRCAACAAREAERPAYRGAGA